MLTKNKGTRMCLWLRVTQDKISYENFILKIYQHKFVLWEAKTTFISRHSDELSAPFRGWKRKWSDIRLARC